MRGKLFLPQRRLAPGQMKMTMVQPKGARHPTVKSRRVLLLMSFLRIPHLQSSLPAGTSCRLICQKLIKLFHKGRINFVLLAARYKPYAMSCRAKKIISARRNNKLKRPAKKRVTRINRITLEKILNLFFIGLFLQLSY
jgi:hypothetical protein